MNIEEKKKQFEEKFVEAGSYKTQGDYDEVWSFIETTIKEAQKEVEALIEEEIIIAQKEGQPTSRLTSLFLKLK
jgi:hypothetical protein